MIQPKMVELNERKEQTAYISVEHFSINLKTALRLPFSWRSIHSGWRTLTVLMKHGCGLLILLYLIKDMSLPVPFPEMALTH